MHMPDKRKLKLVRVLHVVEKLREHIATGLATMITAVLTHGMKRVSYGALCCLECIFCKIEIHSDQKLALILNDNFLLYEQNFKYQED